MKQFIKQLTTSTALSFALIGGAFAGVDTNTSGGLTLAGPGLAVHGHDPVAYFTQGRPVIGDAEFTLVHNDAAYRFSTKEHMAMFKRDPEKYAPQYGGFCAFGVSVGAKFDGDPQLWRVVDDKLYLNLNPDIQRDWLKDVSGNIDKADDNWQRIASKTPESLK